MMLHSPTPMLSVPHRRAPHTRTACRRQRGKPTPPAGNTGGSHTGRAGRRLGTIFLIVWIFPQTDRSWNALVFWARVNSNYITSVNTISLQKSYSKTKRFLFSLLHNQSNVPSWKHLDAAESCFAAPLVAVRLLASMLNQLDWILATWLPPQIHVFCL